MSSFTSLSSRLSFLSLALLSAGCLANPVGSTTTTGGLNTTYGPTGDRNSLNTQHVVYKPLADDETATAKTDGSRDWTYCRGPEFNGISRETGLIDDFDPAGGEGSNVAWKQDTMGGRSTPIVMNGRVYTLTRSNPETDHEGERVICVDAVSGELIWENSFNVWLSDVPDTRVGWSSVVGDPETGNVYALGVCGYFQCIDGETGKTLWSSSMHEEFGLLSTYGGRTNFPIICDDLVVISAVVIGWGEMAKPAHRFVGFDKRSGEVVWFNGTRELPYDTTYSAPSLTVLNGQKALVFGSGDGAVWAIQPRTGRHIWQYRFSRRGLNVPPLVDGSVIYTGHSEENINVTAMGAVAAINGNEQGDVTDSGRVWQVEELMVGKTAPLKIGDRLYLVDDRAKLHILDAKTGEPVVRQKALGTVMRANLLYADGKIYALTANGRWYVLEPDEDKGVNIINKGRFPSGEECHASPICSNGRIYVQTTGGLYCLHDPAKKSAAAAVPASAKETPVSEDQEPSHLQLVPAESLLKPGQKQAFKVRLFNAKGQFLKESKAEFVLQGPGEIGEDGSFTAPADAAHVATIVEAKVDGLVGTARIRIVPDLPWSFDFENNKDAPITWVGARYRHVIRQVDGNNVMVKITTIPKGTRSRCWFGHRDLHDYTIEADVMGARTESQMPDIGLIAQGYTMDLQGNSQRLQIRTWGSHDLRTAKAVPFQWVPDRWYRMKFRAETDGKKAVLRGKVWPKGEDEPEAWTIELTDQSEAANFTANLQGSPGLYGSAKAAELFLDNITISKNE